MNIGEQRKMMEFEPLDVPAQPFEVPEPEIADTDEDRERVVAPEVVPV